MAQRSPQELLQLAESLEREKPHEAIPLLLQLAKMVGEQPALLEMVANSMVAIGQRDDAIKLYRHVVAQVPNQRSAIDSLANLVPDLDEAIDILQRAPSTGSATDFETLITCVRLKEWSARSKLGLPIQHVLDIQDWPFRYALDARDEFDNVTRDMLKANPGDYLVQINRIVAHLITGRIEEGNAALAAFSEPRTKIPYGKMRFGHIPAADVKLPAVKEIKPLTAKEAMFLSCDPVYAKTFVMPLLKSIAAVSPGLAVHIHMVGNDHMLLPAMQRMNLDISITAEDPDSFIAAAKMKGQHYYGAIRLIRFAEIMERSGSTLCMIDVDALAKNDVRKLFQVPGDLAMRVRAGRLELYNQFSACMVKATPAALPYLRAVSAIMADSMSQPWWGADQFALMSAYLALKPELSFMGPKEADIAAADPDSVIWFTAGTAKRGILLGWPVSDQDPARSRYQQMFRAMQ
jgi:hypothetical protein